MGPGLIARTQAATLRTAGSSPGPVGMSTQVCPCVNLAAAGPNLPGCWYEDPRPNDPSCPLPELSGTARSGPSRCHWPARSAPEAGAAPVQRASSTATAMPVADRAHAASPPACRDLPTAVVMGSSPLLWG